MAKFHAGASCSVAIVHDYFTQRGGAERVAEHLANLYPSSHLYTSMLDADVAPATVDLGRIRTTPLQHLRAKGIPLKAFAPVLPKVFARLHLGSPDVVISSSSAFAHHLRPGNPAVHVCYCH